MIQAIFRMWPRHLRGPQLPERQSLQQSLRLREFGSAILLEERKVSLEPKTCNNARHLDLIKSTQLDRCPSCTKPLFRRHSWKCPCGVSRVACQKCGNQ